MKMTGKTEVESWQLKETPKDIHEHNSTKSNYKQSKLKDYTSRSE